MNNNTLTTINTLTIDTERNEIQREILRILDGIHEPCKIILKQTVDSEVKSIKSELDNLVKKTKGLRKWDLTEEYKVDGYYPSGSGIDFHDGGIVGSPDVELSLILNYDLKNGGKSMEIDTYSDNHHIIGHVTNYEDEEDDMPIRIICKSEIILNKFICWVEKEGIILKKGDWGFVSIFS